MCRKTANIPGTIAENKTKQIFVHTVDEYGRSSFRIVLVAGFDDKVTVVVGHVGLMLENNNDDDKLL